MKIRFFSNLEDLKITADMLKQAAALLQSAAKGEGVSSRFTLTVAITDDDNIARFNKEFRQIDKSTDVLSFPMTQGAEEREEEALLLRYGRPSLGDIIISRDHVYAQAEEYGHSPEREFCFLALHGLLHLLGYDHMEEEEARIMEAKADYYLDVFNIKR